MIKSVIKSTARHKLGEATTVFFTDTLLDQWAEDAQLDITWKSKCKRTRASFTTTALSETTAVTQDIVRYTLSTVLPGCLAIAEGGIKVYNSSTNRWLKLKYISKDDLDAQYPHWEKAAAGVPLRYWYDVEINELLLYPSADSDHVGTNYCEGTYIETPDAMSTESTAPDIPTVLHPAVIDYIVATGLESRGYRDIANASWNDYLRKLHDFQVKRRDKEDAEIIMHT